MLDKGKKDKKPELDSFFVYNKTLFSIFCFAWFFPDIFFYWNSLWDRIHKNLGDSWWGLFMMKIYRKGIINLRLVFEYGNNDHEGDIFILLYEALEWMLFIFLNSRESSCSIRDITQNPRKKIFENIYAYLIIFSQEQFFNQLGIKYTHR